MEDKTKWIDLRDSCGQLQARFNPQTLELMIKRGQTTVHDLSRYMLDKMQTGTRQERESVLK